MNEAILNLISNEQMRESCYIKAQNIIENAGLKSIEVDRTQFTARNDNNKLIIRIGARQGNYQGMPAKRIYQIKVVASVVPERVLVNGQKATYRYNGMTLSLIVDVGSVGSEEVKTVEISYPSDSQCMANGEIGQMRRVRENVCLLKERDADVLEEYDLAAGVGAVLAGQNAQKAGLTGAVRGDQGDLVALVDVEADVLKQDFRPV